MATKSEFSLVYFAVPDYVKINVFCIPKLQLFAERRMGRHFIIV